MFHQIRRDGKTEIATSGLASISGGVDAYDFPSKIDQWTAAIATTQRRICLNHTLRHCTVPELEGRGLAR